MQKSKLQTKIKKVSKDFGFCIVILIFDI